MTRQREYPTEASREQGNGKLGLTELGVETADLALSQSLFGCLIQVCDARTCKAYTDCTNACTEVMMVAEPL
jgi:hypothetical protein